jgi:L-ascorbate metabolism protein UlaG (beta-lactamase superfamily)
VTGSLTFIGTATTLISYGGFTLLTDPNFLHRGQRGLPGQGAVLPAPHRAGDADP